LKLLAAISADMPPFKHQEQVPRKQGLKLLLLKVVVLFILWHQEQVPRKQGLKLVKSLTCQTVTWPSRASSTKTRIETGRLLLRQLRFHDHQEQVPRKQGLKLSPLNSFVGLFNAHQEQVPRKQGLKLFVGGVNQGSFEHQEQVPRKQGLKLCHFVHQNF